MIKKIVIPKRKTYITLLILWGLGNFGLFSTVDLSVSLKGTAFVLFLLGGILLIDRGFYRFAFRPKINVKSNTN